MLTLPPAYDSLPPVYDDKDLPKYSEVAVVQPPVNEESPPSYVSEPPAATSIRQLDCTSSAPAHDAT